MLSWVCLVLVLKVEVSLKRIFDAYLICNPTQNVDAPTLRKRTTETSTQNDTIARTENGSFSQERGGGGRGSNACERAAEDGTDRGGGGGAVFEKK